MTPGTTTPTTTPATITTDTRAHTVARPKRSGVSVRTRITLVIALLVALALTGSGAIVYLIEHERNREHAMDEVEQEVEEFIRFQENGLDPDTGETFGGVVPLLEAFLERNVPSPSEAFLAWYDGAALPGQAPGDDAYLGDQEFDRIVEDLTPSNGDRLWESPTDGEVLIAVQSVQFENDDRVGALVVVQELSERDALLNETMRTYAIVAFLSLLLVLVIALWQSGRLLSPLRTLRATAERIGATDLSQRLPVRGNDDITALTRTVNGMLERLESGVRLPKTVPRRRRPRAADTVDRAQRAPRATRLRQHRGGRGDPQATARRGGTDGATHPRPDPAGEDRPARLPTDRRAST